MKIAIFTRNELRHRFVKVALSNFKHVNTLFTLVEKNNIKDNYKFLPKTKDKIFFKKHFNKRNKTERKFFSDNLKKIGDNSNSLKVDSNQINDLNFHKKIAKDKPDYIFTFGCSIIDEKIIKFYNNKIINFHLGLSPYFRGSGTNFWPLVLNKPEYVGVTIMYMNEGIDKGKIIHQIRPKILRGDSPHDIGCRVILDMANIFLPLINNISKLKAQKPKKIKNEYYFKRKDNNIESLKKLYSNFKNNLLLRYLSNKQSLDKKVQIVENNILKDLY